MATSILIIDDSNQVRAQIVKTLQKVSLFDDYLEAADGIEAFKLVLNSPVDLILCDLEMPRMDGFKFISMLQTRDELKDIPVIMLTGREDRDLKIKGLEEGACDYVTKPFDAGELVARVKVQLKIKCLQDELKRSNELLKQLSNTDPLTHLYNRRYLMEALDREYQRAARKESSLSLIIIDIDHFKKVNDNYGHQQGDVVLAAVAALLKKMVRSYDVAARYGGEEFVVLLSETALSQAMLFAERFRCAVQEIVFTGKMNGLTITVSLGVATFPSAKVDCVDSLFRQADEALYKAKQGGRNKAEAMS
ncbi:response receiver-modulated diguanylate cyclase [Geotalea daltonii FRC-32]|uniref:diguanylate cyclase n=1 Tax=Geotalea daltonii (strain DSM 22248 / JCM 15807 / FRC-32) TaxID=316067 RepID=B9M343_GEODF|nr:diguanylate cyclase [Geotalea daltonii]ACM19453.1 response receiver-modulated diguanylate cyclase [Geotalea daltonii FRC-32]